MENLNDKNQLLNSYNFYFDSQFNIDISKKDLIDLYLNEKRNKNDLHFISSKGLLDIRLLQWDSNFFSAPLARIDNFYSINKEYYNVLWKKTIDWIKTNKIEHLTFRVNLSNIDTINFIEKKGFKQIVNKVLCRLSLSNKQFKPYDTNIKFQTPQLKDIEILIKLSSDNFTENRFYKDAYFGKSNINQIYINWVKNRIYQNPNDVIMLLFEEKIAGFAMINTWNETILKKFGMIELIAVSKEFKQKGFGKLLIEQASNKLKKNGIEIVLSNIVETNIPSIKSFQSVGFEQYSLISEYSITI